MAEDEGSNRTANTDKSGQPDSGVGSTGDDREEVRGIIPDKWQQEVLEHKGHFLLCTGRQVGKTTTFARKAAERMISQREARIIVVSLTEDQAQLMIIMVLTFLEKNYKKLISKGKKAPTKNKIQLTNGSQILARPVGNTGDAVRGFTGDVLIIDEASRMPESMFIAAKPTLLTTGGELWICSTPAGKQGYFFNCFINKHNRFKVFHISSEEVIEKREISDTWTLTQRTEALRLLDEEKLDMTELQYGQEYLGLFQEDLQRLFTDEMIDKRCTLQKTKRIDKNVMHFCGIDIARLGADEGTFEVLDRMENKKLRHVESIVTKKQLTTQTYDRLLALDVVWNFKQIGIDVGSGTLGVGLWDFLLRSPVKRKIVDLDNKKRNLDHRGEKQTALLMEDMYSNLLMLMERDEIRLLDDDNVRMSLASVQWQYIQKPGQKTKIKIFGNYTHIVEGIVRAAWLATQKHINTRILWV